MERVFEVCFLFMGIWVLIGCSSSGSDDGCFVSVSTDCSESKVDQLLTDTHGQ